MSKTIYVAVILDTLKSVSVLGTDSNGQIISTSTTGTGNAVLATAPTVSSLTVTSSITLSSSNIITDTSTGTKIGTATNQKLGFYNSTPIVQPSGNALTALSNLGLISSPTLTKSDVSLGNVDNTSDTTKNSASVTLTNKTLDNTNTITLKDSLFTLQDDGDTSKQLVFQLSGIGTSTTRTITVPDASGTVTLLGNSSTGSGSVVLSNSPTLTTPVLNGTPTGTGVSSSNTASTLVLRDGSGNFSAGVITATTINKVTLTAPSSGSTLTIADGKILTVNNSITFAGTDSTTMTFPTTSASIARTDAANTFTGHQTIEGVTSTGATGTGKFVFDNSPTLITPILGVASATTINKVTITAPTSSATITITDGKTLSISNTLTFSGTDSSTLNIGTGGTLGTAAYTASSAYEVPLTFSTGLTRSTNTITINTTQNIAKLSNLTSNGIVTTGGSDGTLSITATTGSGNVVLATSSTIVTPTIVKLANLTSNGPVYTSGSDGTLNIGTTTGSGTVFVLGTSPTITTPTIAKLANLTSNGFIKTSSSDGTLSVDTTAGYGKANIHLDVQNAKLPTSNAARIDASQQMWALLFDPATSQSAQWQFVMPQDYGTGLQVRILFSMASTQSGTNATIFRAYVMKDTEGDTESANSNGYASANSGTETLLNNQTAGYVRSLVITLTNEDSVVAGDFVQFKLDRDASNVSDTATSDAQVLGIILEYTKA